MTDAESNAGDTDQRQFPDGHQLVHCTSSSKCHQSLHHPSLANHHFEKKWIQLHVACLNQCEIQFTIN